MNYDASKKALISLTNNLAAFFAPEVRVNCVCPGWINTKMNKELALELAKKETTFAISSASAKRFKNIFSSSCFLNSAASYINNAIIVVDGGVK